MSNQKIQMATSGVSMRLSEGIQRPKSCGLQTSNGWLRKNIPFIVAVLTMTLAVCVKFSVGRTQASVDPNIPLPGFGSSTAAVFMNNVGFSFRIYLSEFSTIFQPANSNAAVSQVKDGTSLYAVLNQYRPTDADVLHFLPFYFSKISVAVNILEISDQRHIIYMTLEDIAGILTGKYKRWNEIIKKQPEYDNNIPELVKDEDITVVIRLDSCSETWYLSQALAHENSWINMFGVNPVFEQFPSTYCEDNGLKCQYSYNDMGTVGFIMTTNFAFGYSPTITLQMYRNQLILPKIQHKDGTWLDPLVHSFTPLLETLEYEDLLRQRDDGNSSVRDTWPIGGLEYIVMSKKLNTTLFTPSQWRMLCLFFHWDIGQDKIQQYFRYMSLTVLGDKFNKLTLNYLESQVKHENTPILEYLERPQHEPHEAYITFFAIQLALGVISISVVLAYVIRDFKNIPGPALWFLFVLVTGGILNTVCTIFFFMIPKHDWICQLRLWLGCMGLSLMFSAIFVRAYQIRVIYSIGRSSKILTTKQNKARNLFTVISSLGILIFIQVCLVAWSAINSPHWFRDSIDDIELTFLYACTARHEAAWYYVELAYFAALLTFGIYVVYSTWDMKHLVLESKWIGICIYNSAFILIICVTLAVAGDVTDDVIFWMAMLGFSVLSSFNLILLYVPKLLKSDLIEHDSTQSSGGTRTEQV